MQDPHQAHWDAVFRLLRHLKYGPGQGILLSPSSYLDLHMYCDSDWANLMSCRSVTGYFIKLGTAYFLKMKNQDIVSRSSTEA